MAKRIIEIGNAAWLSIQHRQLVIKREETTVTIPVEDIGILILDHPAISYTQGLMTPCYENHVAVIICGHTHMPGALLLPLEGHSLHSRTLAAQAKMTQPQRKQLWQIIVQAKITEQAKVLRSVSGDASELFALAKRVRSGDPENLEAQAARIYWPRLFGKDFRRDPQLSGINILLNYGYSILRSAIARAIVATGLHPALGLHHHNQYNSFCLADDLMEPLRPRVDAKIIILQKSTPAPILDQTSKYALLQTLTDTCNSREQQIPLLSALQNYTASAKDYILGKTKSLELPL